MTITLQAKILSGVHNNDMKPETVTLVEVTAGASSGRLNQDFLLI